MEMQSNFCPSCGQKAGLSPRSVGAAFADVLGSVFSYDNKLWRSLAVLCFKPGKLTKAYGLGQRARYLDPLRLFLVMLALVFLAPDTFHVGEYQLSEEWMQPAAEDASFLDRMRIGNERVRELSMGDREEFFTFLNQVAKRFLVFDFIIGIACLSLFLRLIRWKSYLVEHFVFALHFSSFIMLSNLLLRLVLPDVGYSAIESVFMTTVQCVYFPWSFMVVYSKPGKWNRSQAFLVSVISMLMFLLPYSLAAQRTAHYVLMPPAG